MGFELIRLGCSRYDEPLRPSVYWESDGNENHAEKNYAGFGSLNHHGL